MRSPPSDRFEAAGVDSMALLKVLLYVEQEFGFWVPDDDLVDANLASATTLARYLAGPRRRSSAWRVVR